eukprot:14642845-Alexandrium_andersonii.AAC.1
MQGVVDGAELATLVAEVVRLQAARSHRLVQGSVHGVEHLHADLRHRVLRQHAEGDLLSDDGLERRLDIAQLADGLVGVARADVAEDMRRREGAVVAGEELDATGVDVRGVVALHVEVVA